MLDGIKVQLTGGLGNQLFGFAAGLEQARRLDCKLYLDVAAYNASNPRYSFAEYFTIPGIDIEIVGKQSFSRGGKGAWPFRKIYKEKGFGYDPAINNISEGTTLVGYFQSHKYFQRSSQEIVFMLESLMAGVDSLMDTNLVQSLAVHVRRGDYLLPHAKSFHGLATIDFFKSSVDFASRTKFFDKLLLFSDSIDVASKEFTASGIGFEVGTVADEKNPFRDMLMMSSSDAMIISNSTYSWWAAFLMTYRDSEALVIAPRPWFANGDCGTDLLLPNWITFGSQ